MAKVSIAYIKDKAKEQGMSLKALEEKAGIGNGTIAKWEDNNPNLASLQKIADVLECAVKDLIFEA